MAWPFALAWEKPSDPKSVNGSTLQLDAEQELGASAIHSAEELSGFVEGAWVVVNVHFDPSAIWST